MTLPADSRLAAISRTPRDGPLNAGRAAVGPPRRYAVVAARAALLGMLLQLFACASKPLPRAPLPGQESAPWPGAELFENQFGDDIPAILAQAMADAYAQPQPLACAALIAELNQLESVLGEDLDSRPGEPADPDLLADAMTGAVKGMIPYRSVLLQISGESARTRRGVAAITAGNIRRAYLKGVGEGLGCSPPAAPKRAVKPIGPP